jgi:hypothetical protein
MPQFNKSSYCWDMGKKSPHKHWFGSERGWGCLFEMFARAGEV